MRIPCPYCGDRDIHEFVCRGEAPTVRPAGDDAPEAFHAYVYLRQNPMGPTREHWYHASGCRKWLIVARDTRTHDIADARFATERCA